MCVDCVLISPRIAQVDLATDPFLRWFCHRGCHHHAILTLDDTILLWVVGHCVMMMYALRCTILYELPHCESPPRSVWSALIFRPNSPSVLTWISLIV
jgi:hypothetical protein